MKNLMVADGCQDYGFDVHRISDEDFTQLMSRSNGNVIFIEDVYDRDDYKEMFQMFHRMWYGRISNKDVNGIDGILFYENIDRRTGYYDLKSDNAIKSTIVNDRSSQRKKHVIIFGANPMIKVFACAIDQEAFHNIFPAKDQNIAFIEEGNSKKFGGKNYSIDFFKRRVINLDEVKSISGILYVGFSRWIPKYPDKIDESMPRHYPITS